MADVKWTSTQQLALYIVAKHVPDENVAFLDARGILGRHTEALVEQSTQLSAILSSKSHRECAHRTRRLHRFDDIGAVSWCAAGRQAVSGVAECLSLAG